MKPDIDHIVPDLLQARARKLGLLITADANQEKGLDFGPFLLRCGQTGYLVWAGGLPAEGIADALNCFERERKLPDEEIGEAWRDFGARWQREPYHARTDKRATSMSKIFVNPKANLSVEGWRDVIPDLEIITAEFSAGVRAMKSFEMMEITLPNGQTVYGVRDIAEPIIIAFPTEAQAREFVALARSGASPDVLVEFIKGNTVQ